MIAIFAFSSGCRRDWATELGLRNLRDERVMGLEFDDASDILWWNCKGWIGFVCHFGPVVRVVKAFNGIDQTLLLIMKPSCESVACIRSRRRGSSSVGSHCSKAILVAKK